MTEQPKLANLSTKPNKIDRILNALGERKINKGGQYGLDLEIHSQIKEIMSQDSKVDLSKIKKVDPTSEDLPAIIVDAEKAFRGVNMPITQTQ